MEPAITEYSSAGNCIDSHDNEFSLFYIEKKKNTDSLFKTEFCRHLKQGEHNPLLSFRLQAIL